MRMLVWITAVAALAGCGAAEPEDRTAELVACFERAGGTVVERPAQLADFPTEHAEYSTGFSLESIALDSIDAGTGDQFQTLVLVHKPQIPQPASSRAIAADELIRRAQRGERTGARELIVLPASPDLNPAPNDCAEQVAGDQIFP